MQAGLAVTALFGCVLHQRQGRAAVAMEDARKTGLASVTAAGPEKTVLFWLTVPPEASASADLVCALKASVARNVSLTYVKTAEYTRQATPLTTLCQGYALTMGAARRQVDVFVPLAGLAQGVQIEQHVSETALGTVPALVPETVEGYVHVPFTSCPESHSTHLDFQEKTAPLSIALDGSMARSVLAEVLANNQEEKTYVTAFSILATICDTLGLAVTDHLNFSCSAFPPQSGP
mmetsp:Transcript_4334/g.9595  ORF Transcript_4334/g.9595 Transcript_4334/m.9595 type:complete len:234 (+) Transcript_4334:607-1308(+)